MIGRGRWRRWRARLQPVSGNHITLLQNGAAFFPALVAAIDTAQHEIHLETYIFHADRSTEAVHDALLRAAARGVAVQVLIDGIGSRDFPDAWRQSFQTAGVRLLTYHPLVSVWRANPRSLRRLHRKLAVIDARLAFVGGINLIDDFEPRRHEVARLDFSTVVEGPILARIHHSTRRLWKRVARAQLQRDEATSPVIKPSWPNEGHQRVAFVERDNFAHRRDIERSYVAALARAQSEILLANAYFLPGSRFRKLLKKAAARGVIVKLLVQGRTDHPFFQAAARALYGDLMAAGVQIAEYRASELHAKVAVIDGQWATVGSSNIDPFSLLMAREANIVVEDARFAADLGQRLDAAFNAASALDPDRWQRRPWTRRVLSWLAYGVVRGIVGLVGAGRWA